MPCRAKSLVNFELEQYDKILMLFFESAASSNLIDFGHYVPVSDGRCFEKRTLELKVKGRDLRVPLERRIIHLRVDVH